MKKIYLGLLAILVIIIGVAYYGASQSGVLIQNAITTYAPKATGADVTLDRVQVSLLGGKASLSGLTIANPPGFKSGYAFKIGRMAVNIDMESLFGKVVHIKEIRIDAADLIYEVGTNGNNITKIQKNITAYSKKLGLKTSKSDSEVKFIVDNIYITGTRVKLASNLLKGKGAQLTLPDIHLKNIGTEDKAATAGEVGSVIFSAINKGLSKIATKDILNNSLKNIGKKLGNIFK